MTKNAILFAVLLCVAGFSAGCAAYRFGHQSMFPQHIETIHVPIFESGSFRRNLGEWLTEAVVKTIERRTTFKVVNDPAQADSTLTGRLVSDVKQMSFPGPTGDMREANVNFLVQVTWTDRRGQVLRDAAAPIDAATAELFGTSRFVPETGQSMVTAQQQAIQRVAEQIVNLMEVPW